MEMATYEYSSRLHANATTVDGFNLALSSLTQSHIIYISLLNDIGFSFWQSGPRHRLRVTTRLVSVQETRRSWLYRVCRLQECRRQHRCRVAERRVLGASSSLADRSIIGCSSDEEMIDFVWKCCANSLTRFVWTDERSCEIHRDSLARGRDWFVGFGALSRLVRYWRAGMDSIWSFPACIWCECSADASFDVIIIDLLWYICFFN